MSKNEDCPSALTQCGASRRGIFRALKSATQKAAQQPSRDPVAVPLPPGALPGPLFHEKCHQCHQCIAACPMGVLVMHKKGFPVMAIDYASCDGCLLCVKACSSGALVTPSPFDTKLRPRIKRNCVNPSRICLQCVTSCPTQACLAEKDGLPVINSDRCNGCGECKVQCDYGAIEMVCAI